MSFFEELFGNLLLMAPICAWFVAQIAKTILHASLNRKFVPERMVGGGGMPSSHSATVCALSTAAFIKFGPASFEFAMATIFSIVTMYDAMGVRRETGIQGEVLNDLIETLKNMGTDLKTDKSLKELVGHTPLQVLVGAILGIAVAVIMNNII